LPPATILRVLGDIDPARVAAERPRMLLLLLGWLLLATVWAGLAEVRFVRPPEFVLLSVAAGLLLLMTLVQLYRSARANGDSAAGAGLLIFVGVLSWVMIFVFAVIEWVRAGRLLRRLGLRPGLWTPSPTEARARVLGDVCRACGYDLTGNVSGRCPECGTAVAATPPKADEPARIRVS
jgi:hypothetical protein